MTLRGQTLGDLLDEMAVARPDAEAIVFCGQRLTYAALHHHADLVARALLALGVRQGDRRPATGKVLKPRLREELACGP